jgi:hypothetical protein
MKRSTLIQSLLLTTILAASAGAQAQEIYGGAGILGVQLGYAHAINPNFTVRGDYMTMGRKEKTQVESGTTFNAKVGFSRLAIVGDWFPSASSGFRVSGGLTSNNMGVELKTSGSGTVDIDNQQYILSGADSFTVKVKLPSTAPYLGIGYGHQKGEKGLGFHADFGAILSGFKVSEVRTGALTSISQAQVDRELASIKDSVGKLKLFPQLTVGLSYRF